MQPHEQHDPEQRKPDPPDKRAMWLLLVIAILLGLITTRLLDRISVGIKLLALQAVLRERRLWLPFCTVPALSRCRTDA
jgi:hypothetical protein